MEKLKAPTISIAQFASILVICSFVVGLTASRVMLGKNQQIQDYIISAGLAFLATLVLTLPIFSLYSMDKTADLYKNSLNLLGKFGYFVVFIYGVYYFSVCIYTLTSFNDLITNVMNPPMPTTALAIVITIVCCYAANKGIEGIARTAGAAFVLIVFSLIVLIISVWPQIKPENFMPFFYDGKQSLWDGFLFMISRSFVIPAMLMLLPMAKGDAKKGIFAWVFGAYALTAVLLTVIVGSLGDFVKTQLYPLFSVAGISSVGYFEHLDAIYLGIWSMGVFVKISLFLLLTSNLIKNFFGKTVSKFSVWVLGILFIISSIFIRNNWLAKVFNTWVLLWVVLTFSVFIPLILIIIKLIKPKKEMNETVKESVN